MRARDWQACVAPAHRVFAIEYYCTHCREKHEGRFFKKTSTQDLRHDRESEERLASMRT